MASDVSAPTADSRPAKPATGKSHATEHVFELTEDIHMSEASFLKDKTPAHKFEVKHRLLSLAPWR